MNFTYYEIDKTGLKPILIITIKLAHRATAKVHIQITTPADIHYETPSSV